MNKQDALKQIEEQRDMILDLHGWGVFGYIKGIINQLDEPQKIELPKVEFKKFQKVKVPQFVADWIEVCKEHLTSSLYLAMTPSFLKSNNQGIELTLWIKKNEETFARAWLYGYEVEKEKRYFVKIKGICGKHETLNREKHSNKWLFSDREENSLYETKHTRKELEEADFGWVFSCEGIEVKEVE